MKHATTLGLTGLLLVMMAAMACQKDNPQSEKKSKRDDAGYQKKYIFANKSKKG